MIEFTIKKARLEDVKAIGALITYTWRLSYKNIIDKNYLSSLSADERSEFISEALISGSYLSDCAWHNDRIIGISLYRRHSIPGLSGYGELSCLYVDKKFENNGVGSRLLDISINYMRSVGLNYILLNVLSDNTPAVEFYRKRGFVAVIQNELELGDKRYPFYLMSRKLT